MFVDACEEELGCSQQRTRDQPGQCPEGNAFVFGLEFLLVCSRFAAVLLSFIHYVFRCFLGQRRIPEELEETATTSEGQYNGSLVVLECLCHYRHELLTINASSTIWLLSMQIELWIALFIEQNHLIKSFYCYSTWDHDTAFD